MVYKHVTQGSIAQYIMIKNRTRSTSIGNFVHSIFINNKVKNNEKILSMRIDEESQLKGETCLMSDNPNIPFLFAAKGKTTDIEMLIAGNADIVQRRDNKGMTMLHHAASNSMIETMDVLLVARADLNAKDDDGMTPIHHAVWRSQSYAISYLILNGADPNIQDNKSLTPLHLAVTQKKLEIIEELLKHPEVEKDALTNVGNTGVHIACEIDFPEGLEYLINHKARICIPNKYGMFPIHLAIKHCNEQCLKVIVSTRPEGICSATKIMNFADKEGNVPLHAAVNTGDPKSVKMCLELGAQIDVQQNDKSTPVHYACTKGEFEIVKLMLQAQSNVKERVLQIKDNNGHTPLHKAAMFNHVEMTQYLIEEGSDLEMQDDNGYTPLLLCASRLCMDVFVLLLKFKANLRAKDNMQRNIIHLLTLNVLNNKTDFISKIEKIQPSLIDLVNEKDDMGCTPLHYSTRRGLLRLTGNLLKFGGLCMLQNNDKDTPLHFAARYGRIHTCRKLLNTLDGIKAMNSTDSFGQLPIHSAAENGHTKIIQMLLDRGCIFHRCYHGNTPLHLAAANGYMDTCQYLIEINQSLLDNENQDGKTALHLAAINDRANIVGLLLSQGALVLKDKEGLNFLTHIIKLKNLQAAKEVIQSSRWEEITNTIDDSGICPMIGLIKDMPSICSLAMDKSIKTDGNRGNKEFSIVYNFGILQQAISNLEQKKRDPFYVVKTMVEMNRIDLLMHPLCNAYLKMKWDRFGKWVQLLIMLTYILFLTSLSTCTMLLSELPFKHPDNGDQLSEECFKMDTFYGEKQWKKDVIKMTAAIVFIFSVLSLVKEFFQIVTQRLSYCSDVGNYIDLVLYGCSITVSVMILRNEVGHRTMEITTVAIFLAWCNFLLLFFQFEMVGLYVIMFVQILHTVIWVLLIFSILFIGFAFSFLILFNVSLNNNYNMSMGDKCFSNNSYVNNTFGNLDVSLKAWQTYPFSLLKVLMMMMGEYDYLATFVAPYFDNNPYTLHYPEMTFFFLVIFIIFISLLLMNLLIGLAVGDIEAVRCNATLKRISLQVVWLSDFESKLPMTIRNWAFREIWTVHPFNCPLSKLSPSENQIVYKKQEKDESFNINNVNEILSIQSKQIMDLSTESRQQNDLLKLILQKMEIDPEAEISDDIMPENTFSKNWKTALKTTSFIGKMQKSLKSPMKK